MIINDACLFIDIYLVLMLMPNFWLFNEVTAEKWSVDLTACRNSATLRPGFDWQLVTSSDSMSLCGMRERKER